VIYPQYVAPVLTVLRKESKWSWSSAIQRALEEMGEKFAYSIHIVQPDDTLDQSCIINNDASAKTIETVLKQEVKTAGSTSYLRLLISSRQLT